MAAPAMRDVVDREEMRALRKSRGLTAEDVAQSVGVSPSMIWAWERGANAPIDEARYQRWRSALDN